MRFTLLILFLFAVSISIAQPPMPLNDCGDSPYYSIKNDSIKYGVVNSAGDTLVPVVYDMAFFDRELIEFCGRNRHLVILSLNGRMKGVNLITSESTDWHEGMLFLNHHFFFQDSLTWGAYDENINIVLDNNVGQLGILIGPELGFGSPDLLNDYFFNSYYYELANSGDWLKKNSNVSGGNDVVSNSIDLSPTTEKALMKWAKKNIKNPDRYSHPMITGMMHLKNGRKIKPKYHHIEAKLFEDKLYYWCYIYGSRSILISHFAFTGKIDVFDSELKKMNTIELDHIGNNLTPSVYQIYDTLKRKALIPICDPKSRFGAVNSRGDVIIPFVNDSVLFDYFKGYKVWNDGKVAYYNSSGEHVFGKEYYDVYWNVSGPYHKVKIDTNDHPWIIVNDIGEHISEPFSDIGFLNYYGYSKVKKEIQELGVPSLLCIKNNTAYIYVKDSLYRLDSSNVDFILPTQLIYKMIVDVNGTIIKRNNSLNQWSNCYTVTDDEGAYIVSLDGEKIKTFKGGLFAYPLTPDKIRINFMGSVYKYFNPITWEEREE